MYARPWQLEMIFRFGKSDLALQRPRVWHSTTRRKLLQADTLALGFLLRLVRPEVKRLRDDLLERVCHRKGKRSRETPAPLYRIRAALAYL